MTMETIFLIVLAAFNVWTIYFYNKLLLEVANGKEKEKKPPIDPMALVGKSLFKVSQLRKKGETEQKQTESMSVSDNDVTFDDSPKSTARISDEQLDDVFTNVRIEDIGVKYSDNKKDADVPQSTHTDFSLFPFLFSLLLQEVSFFPYLSASAPSRTDTTEKPPQSVHSFLFDSRIAEYPSYQLRLGNHIEGISLRFFELALVMSTNIRYHCSFPRRSPDI